MGSGRGSRGGAWAGPAGLGAPFPSALPAAALVTWSASPGPQWAPPWRWVEAVGGPCPWEGGRARVPGGGCGALCVHPCVCVCAHCSTGRLYGTSGGAGGGGGVKGASETMGLSQNLGGLSTSGPVPSMDTPRDRNAHPLYTHKRTNTLRHTFQGHPHTSRHLTLEYTQIPKCFLLYTYSAHTHTQTWRQSQLRYPTHI